MCIFQQQRIIGFDSEKELKFVDLYFIENDFLINKKEKVVLLLFFWKTND